MKSSTASKQQVMKPQDLLVALKLVVSESRKLTFNDFANELFISASEAHASVRRAESCRLIVRVDDGPIAVKTSLQEFLLHGLIYTFPASFGSPTRGYVTGASAPPLNQYFDQDAAPVFVWPHKNGDARGIALHPIYPSVPEACHYDPQLYRLIAVLDALRAGGARERELAAVELVKELA